MWGESERPGHEEIGEKEGIRKEFKHNNERKNRFSGIARGEQRGGGVWG